MGVAIMALVYKILETNLLFGLLNLPELFTRMLILLPMLV
jgi:hypothetical protein